MLWHRRHKPKKQELPDQGDGLTVGQRFDVGETAWDALGRGIQGSPFNLMTLALAGADLAISTGTAKRGNAARAAAGAAAAQVTGLGGFLAGRAAGAAVGTFIAGPVGTTIGSVIGGGVGAMVGDKIARSGTIRTIKLLNDSRPRVRFGGNFKDTQPAYNMRQLAEQQLSSSLLNARRYLGSEAQLMHQ